MAVWYYDNGYKKATFARGDTGSDAYLYLPGPSLSEVDFDVCIPGTVAFAVNTAYPKVKPHYWVGMDKPECYHPDLFFEAFPKFVRGTYARKTYKGKDVSKYPNTYFMDISKPENGIDGLFTLKGDGVQFAWFNHTLAVVLHLILFMGFKKIHFVGCDLGGDKDYYDDRVLTPEQRAYNKRLYDGQVVFIKEFSELATKHGIELISCTEHSPINRYMPYIPLKRAISLSRGVVGEKHEIKHALDVTADENKILAEKIKWIEPIRERGVMVMCDKNQEWLLPWWWYHYTKYNSSPVQFVDIGMTKDGADFCKARGGYTRLPDIQLKGWFMKPFALKMTQFRKTIYMDLDCEIRGSLYDVFNFDGFAVAKDKLNNFSKVKEPVNTGVIVYDWGHELIDRWCDETVVGWFKSRSDQEILDHINKQYTELSHDVHWLRIMGENSRALIYHHTGTVGKNTIKRMINDWQTP